MDPTGNILFIDQYFSMGKSHWRIVIYNSSGVRVTPGSSGIIHLPEVNMLNPPARPFFTEDGSLFILGGGSTDGSTLAKVAKTGGVDPTFGANGVAQISSLGKINGLKFFADGNILLYGDSVIRLLRNGQTDPLFVKSPHIGSVGVVRSVSNPYQLLFIGDRSHEGYTEGAYRIWF